MMTLSDPPLYVTARQAAKLVERTVPTLHRWRKQGRFEIHHTDERGVAMYLTADIIAAAENKPRPGPKPRQFDPVVGDDGEPEPIPDINAERALHEKAKRIKAELDLEQRAGSLISAAEATRAWENVAAIVRDRVMGIIPRVAPVVAALDDTRDVKATLDEALREALTVLREPEVKR